MSLRPNLRVVLGVAVLLLMGFGGVALTAWNALNKEIGSVASEQKIFTVPKGANLHTVAAELQQKDILEWPAVWLLYAKLERSTDIKAGQYRLHDDDTALTLLARFCRGELIEYDFVIVEGQTLNQVLAQMRQNEKIKTTLDYPLDMHNSAALGLDLPYLEGWFYPDTYQFNEGDTDVSILLRAHERMRDVLQDEWQNRDPDLPLKTPYEALILASIVEKETGAAFERPQIAGVFIRRLQKRMRLQTDPTVIYGLGDSYDGNLRRRDLKTPNPYNTYLNRGLPPTPIALPGRAAIAAALHPDRGSALYFVAKGDGTHQFSDTIEEHNLAVRKFQKRRVNNYHSSFGASDNNSESNNK